MNKKPTIYALRMTAGLSDTDDGKFKAHDSVIFPNNRAWYRSIDDGPFDLYISDSDSEAPQLVYYLGRTDASDKVQFEVYFTGATLAETSNVHIIASFGAKKHSGTKRSTPFRQPDSNAKTILGLEGAKHIPKMDGFVIGPYQPKPFSIVPLGPQPMQDYEFSLVASFTKTVDGVAEVVQFGYDPEMDIDPQTGP